MSTTTLPDGGDDDVDDRWERLGRELLAEQLEGVPLGDLHDAFMNAKKRVEKGEEVTGEDIEEMRQALRDAAQVVDRAAEVSPDAAPAPDMWAYLDDDARKEYREDAERRLSEAGESDE